MSNFTAPRGTKDILPQDTRKWQYIEKQLTQESALFGYKEIRVPTFEHTELFTRSVGDATDVVSKEMYTFTDKGDRSITLRPEGTAGVARACLQNGLLNESMPLKVFYQLNCFRYEKPQHGRYREFKQFGAEMYGTVAPVADAEMIAYARDLYELLEITNFSVEINSIGCTVCRDAYQSTLKEFFTSKKESLCGTCHDRLDKNPMRIIDCKSSVCSEIADEAPKMLDHLCSDCKQHFEQLQKLLAETEVNYHINPNIVRGLDYYTRTVFEFIYEDNDGEKLVLGGGGRYGGLMKQLGGPDIEGVGFAMGLDRIMLVLEKQQFEFPPEQECDLFIASIGELGTLRALKLANGLRVHGYYAECDLMARSLKAQLKYANKIGAKYTMVLGDDDIANNEAQLKNMFVKKASSRLPLDDSFYNHFAKITREDQLGELDESMQFSNPFTNMMKSEAFIDMIKDLGNSSFNPKEK